MCEHKDQLNEVRAMLRLHGLLALLAVFAISPITINVAVGQSPGTEVRAAQPVDGTPPSPRIAAPADSDNDRSSVAASSASAAASFADQSVTNDAFNAHLESTTDSAAEVDSETDFQVADAHPTADAPSAVRNLSVQPGMPSLMPKDCPAWISAAPDFNASVHRITVSSFPVSNQNEVDGALDEPLLAALYGYIDDQLVGEVGASERIGKRISVNYIRRNLIDEPAGYVAELSTSTGPMYQKWVSVSITPEQRVELQSLHREALQRERIVPIGVGVLGLLGLIGLTHAGLRRKHGMPAPTTMPMPNLANQQEPPSANRSGSGFSILGLLACIVVFPALLLLLALTLAVARVDPIQTQIPAVPVPSTPALADYPVELPTLPVAPSEVKLKSGNQMIIIRNQ